MARASSLKICVITGSRSEYGLLRVLMQEIRDDPELELQVVVTGMHLVPGYGNTFRQILDDGFRINARVPMLKKAGVEKHLSDAIARSLPRLSRTLRRLNPHAVVVMGDRFELLAVAVACITLRIPVAHISGGELTEGAFDEQIRHAMTKIAHLHFTAAEPFARRVRQMGEEPWRVCVSGEPGLDNVARLPRMSRKELEKDLGLDLSLPTALVTFHPVTLELDQLHWQTEELFHSLLRAGLQYIITYPNADPGNETIIRRIRKFSAGYKGCVRVIPSLGQKRYLSLLPLVSLMIGNTSSGLVESPSFNLPVVNVGTRQDGRIFAANVFRCGYSSGEIRAAIKRALAYNRSRRIINPYGKGNASHKVKEKLKVVLREKSLDTILRKKFIDL